MIAVIAAILALAGAPASTSVSCTLLPDAGPGTLGEAVIPGQAIYLDGPIICAGLTFAGATPRQRGRLRMHNNADLVRYMGLGLIVALHEATHVALQSNDECLVQTRALGLVPAAFRMLRLPAWSRQEVMDAVRDEDGSLPPQYHGCRNDKIAPHPFQG